MDTDSDADLLYGVPAIAEFMGVRERQCRSRIAAGYIPSFKMGKTICARKSAIKAKIAEYEAARFTARLETADVE